MKKRALKTAVIAFEVIAVAIAISAAALFYLHWRLGQGPVSLHLLRPSVEFAIERRLPEGYDARVGAIELSRAEARGEYRLLLSDVVVLDADDESAANAPAIVTTLELGDFLRGEIGPKTIAVDGASLRIIRRENLQVDIPIVKKKRKQEHAPLLSSLLRGNFLKSAFESAELSNAEITFLDAASGRAWSAPDAQVRLLRSDEGLTALARGAFDMSGVRAAIDANADYKSDIGVVNVVVDGENFPVGDLLSTFYGDEAAIIDAPVSGRAAIAFTADGRVLSSQFDARLGAGAIKVGGARRAVTAVSWETGFDPVSNRFSIHRFDFDVEGAKGGLAGDVSISFGDDIRKPERISFDLRSDEMVVETPAYLPAPVEVRALALNGDYLVAERRLTMRSLAAAFAGVAVKGNVTLLRPRGRNNAPAPTPGVIAALEVDGALTPQSLLSIWPRGLASGARDWVEERLETAIIDNIDFTMNLTPGAVAEDGAMPDESLTLTFDARDAKAYYVREMTPLRNGSGSGVLRGNSFLLNVASAQIGDIRIGKGEVSFPTFMPKWLPTYYRFVVDGEESAMLALLDEPPLSLLSKVELKPEQFSGRAHADVEIMRPNKRDVLPEEYGYKGVATFENMNISDLLGDIQFTDAKGKVDLQTRSMTVSADALIADDAPIKLVWRQNFYEGDGPSNIDISGVFDSSTGDLFGLSTRQLLRGPVAFAAKATGDLGAFKTLDLNADFTQAALTVDALGWRKPGGQPAFGELAMSFSDDAVVVNSLSIAGEGVDIVGGLAFNGYGALQSASLNKFFLADAADLSLNAQREATGVLAFTAVGPYLNAGPLIEQILDGTSSSGGESGIEWGRGVSLQARIDRVGMRGGVEYRDGALDFSRNAERLQALDFTAFGEDGNPLTMMMELTGSEDGPQRAIEARTSQIGKLMSGVFGVDSIKGGDGSMRLALHQAGEPGFAGELEARNLQVINAPLLARIFSAGSLNGLANLMNGEGIAFNYAYGLFDYADGVVSLSELRATGSSVGITAEGDVSFGQGGVANLNGAVAPVYALNSALGNTPIIGDILVGAKGEGVLAFTYRVSGDTGNPSVFVNPLSALTPGIFRELFQPSRTTRPEEAAPVPGEPPATEIPQPSE